MMKRCYVCSTCSRRVDLGPSEIPCDTLKGWYVITGFKGLETVERHNFCCLSCMYKWVENAVPKVPDIFIDSLKDEEES